MHRAVSAEDCLSVVSKRDNGAAFACGTGLNSDQVSVHTADGSGFVGSAVQMAGFARSPSIKLDGTCKCSGH
jgi:hypothetical protein